jgi:HD-like signal output (HDOD) protein/ActR/RegA family two-component response regulator
MVEDDAQDIRLQRVLAGLPVRAIRSRPSYANYVKTLQYAPDVIVMQMPRANAAHLHYIQMVKQHRQLHTIPLLCFGYAFAQEVIDGMVKVGVDRYVPEPFDDQELVDALVSLAAPTATVATQSAKAHAAGPEACGRLLSSTSGREAKLRAMVEHVSGVMAFPFAVARILQLSASNRTSVTDLARIVKSDPVLSAAVLKQCNSVAYAASSRRIGSVKEAILRLGVLGTRRLAMAVGVMDLFASDQGELGFNRASFWYHCLATGVMAQSIAPRVGADPEEAFVAGLLSNFGIILLDEFFPELFSEILRRSTNSAASFDQSMEELTGVASGDIARILFEKWNLPAGVVAAAVCRQGLTQLQTTVPPLDDDDGLTLSVTVARNGCKAFAFGTGVDMVAPMLPGGQARAAGLDTLDAAMALRGTATAALQSFRTLLALGDDQEDDENASERAPDTRSFGVVDADGRGYIPVAAYLVSMGHRVIAVDPSSAGWHGETALGGLHAIIHAGDHPPSAATIAAIGGRMPLLAIVPGRPTAASATVVGDQTDLREIEHRVLGMLR